MGALRRETFRMIAMDLRGHGRSVTDEQMMAVKAPTLGLVGAKDPALRELVRLKARMPRLVRMVSLQDETHGSAPRNPEFVGAILYFLRYHPARLVN
jgi:pimeloyl-ACP methyl ester carboxylesterase